MSDDSTDESLLVVKVVLEQYVNEVRSRLLQVEKADGEELCVHFNLLLRVRILVSSTPLFETAAENLAWTTSSAATKYYASVQADQAISGTGWNFQMGMPLVAASGYIFGVGALRWQMGAHMEKHVHILPGKMIKGKWSDDVVKRVGARMYALRGGYCIRGPLLFDAAKLQKLQFFDEVMWRQGQDDIDLFRRAWTVFRFEGAWYPPQTLGKDKQGLSDMYQSDTDRSSKFHTHNLTHT